tara:strand:- start:1237 stop:2319 length:1083 start_codon:yes stop_codon:yes gene_type:complete
MLDKESAAGFISDPSSANGESVAGINVEDITVDIGSSRILTDVCVQAPQGSSLSILGPSGCGKTTLLRVLAGLQKTKSGSITLDGRCVVSDQVDIPPEQRNVGLVFQDWALFPHLTVLENIVFGLKRSDRKAPTKEIMELLEMVGISELADRLPSSLSGGQQQRVALTRALAPQPSILLLDEPFSSLDTGLRVELRSEVSDLLKLLNVTSVFVTHDQDEAFTLGDEVAVMNEGRVVQHDTPWEIYRHPTNSWVASFVGEINQIPGVASGETAETSIGTVRLCNAAHGAVNVIVRPEEIVLIDGTDSLITRVDYFGHDTIYEITTSSGVDLRCRRGGSPAHQVGDRVDVKHSGITTVSFPK